MGIDQARAEVEDSIFELTGVVCEPHFPIGEEGFGLDDSGCRLLRKKLRIGCRVSQSTRFEDLVQAVVDERLD